MSKKVATQKCSICKKTEAMPLFQNAEDICNNCLSVGNMAWTTGITLLHIEEGWFASCSWRCGNFLTAGCMEGNIGTRYCNESVAKAIDCVLACMAQMNVKRTDEVEELQPLGFALYYDDEHATEIPQVLKQEIEAEAEKRGWQAYAAK